MSTLVNNQNKEYPANDIILEVQDLSFSYSRKQTLILKDISVKFFRNNLTIIAGPNGSGKTTLMKHFNGLLLPQQGHVVVFNKQITKKNRGDIQKLVGLVFENPEEQIFFPKVYEDVAFGPKNMQLSLEEIQDRVENALEEVQITHLKDKVTFNLSFGEKKKVAFAGILAMRPKLIILDEPTIGIDPWTKPRMIEAIRSFTKKRTVIVITHDINVMKIADRILLMKQGKIEGDFSTYEDFQQQEFKNM